MDNDKIQSTNSQFVLYQDDNGIIVDGELLKEASHKYFLLVRQEGNLKNIGVKKCYNTKAISIEKLKSSFRSDPSKQKSKIKNE